MSLPESDTGFLRERGLAPEISIESGMTCVVFRDWSLPEGFDHHYSDLLLRLPAGYPDVAPDMWWFNPPVHMAGGDVIQATEVTEQHLGRDWQRWSRHLAAGQWQPGIDGIESFLALIGKELERCAGAVEAAA